MQGGYIAILYIDNYFVLKVGIESSVEIEDSNFKLGIFLTKNGTSPSKITFLKKIEDRTPFKISVQFPIGGFYSRNNWLRTGKWSDK